MCRCQIHNMDTSNAIPYTDPGFDTIQQYIAQNEKVLVFLEGRITKIKKKAEQMACNSVINLIDNPNVS